MCYTMAPMAPMAPMAQEFALALPGGSSEKYPALRATLISRSDLSMTLKSIQALKVKASFRSPQMKL